MLKRLISILLVIALASACVSTALAATLRKGSKGSEVTRLQNALKALGYYSLKVDGIYGKGTVAAVKAYQQSKIHCGKDKYSDRDWHSYHIQAPKKGIVRYMNSKALREQKLPSPSPAKLRQFL